jgi:hypothetical protein
MTIVVERPLEAADAPDLVAWSVDGSAPRPFGTGAPASVPGPHLVRLHGRDDVDPASVTAPAWRPWPRLRRAATEVRDRALPLRSALAR